jgi:hypothetical protein
MTVQTFSKEIYTTDCSIYLDRVKGIQRYQNNTAQKIEDLTAIAADWQAHPQGNTNKARIIGTVWLVSSVALAVISIPLVLVAIGITTLHLSWFLFQDGRKGLTITPEKARETCQRESMRFEQALTQTKAQFELLKTEMQSKKDSLLADLSHQPSRQVEQYIQKQLTSLDKSIALANEPQPTPVGDPWLLDRLFPGSPAWEPIVIEV